MERRDGGFGLGAAFPIWRFDRLERIRESAFCILFIRFPPVRSVSDSPRGFPVRLTDDGISAFVGLVNGSAHEIFS